MGLINFSDETRSKLIRAINRPLGDSPGASRGRPRDPIPAKIAKATASIAATAPSGSFKVWESSSGSFAASTAANQTAMNWFRQSWSDGDKAILIRHAQSASDTAAASVLVAIKPESSTTPSGSFTIASIPSSITQTINDGNTLTFKEMTTTGITGLNVDISATDTVELKHANTSPIAGSQAISSGQIFKSITIDGMGHVTAFATTTIQAKLKELSGYSTGATQVIGHTAGGDPVWLATQDGCT